MILKLALLRRPYHTFTSRTPPEIPPLPSTISHYLRLLASCEDFKSLLQIHGHLIVSGLKQDHSSVTHLINAYSFFGKCAVARFLFDSTPNPSVILWNSLIRAYTRSGCYKDALRMYHCMGEQGLEPDKYTFNFVVKACTGALDLQEGVLVHHAGTMVGLMPACTLLNDLNQGLSKGKKDHKQGTEIGILLGTAQRVDYFASVIYALVSYAWWKEMTSSHMNGACAGDCRMRASAAGAQIIDSAITHREQIVVLSQYQHKKVA
ncbi:hypothetical protein FEM48_Zijuj03G0071800 [Ziziphus jujuba var. spinosa]|uniref:Pentatricopeptide repeat-containing protein n=1 Tax=Ziziphus jujuba var. spinosa TaxID=714518 RepID=A0A978VNW3_ZIZJJ|nr:hypothetical protein FEM48_Zijuj03G0071800 [Ziziphus jujuba var. spinosa]